MTIDEIFASMPEEDAATGRDYLVIDPVTRQITVPEAEKVFGVVSDEVSVRKYFLCPRYVGDNLDLAGMFLTVYFRNAQGEEDGYMVEDVQIAGEYITFSWLLWPKVTQYNGPVQFAVCADLPNTAAKRRPDWNTTLAEGEVLEGMDPDLGDLETGSSDVLTQLREMVTAQTAAVEATGAAQVAEVKAQGTNTTQEAVAAIQAQGEATVASIPADYTALAATVDRLTRDRAAAIVCAAEGAAIQVADASNDPLQGLRIFGKSTQDGTPTPDAPVEIVSTPAPVVTVCGKNLLRWPLHEPSITRNGVTYTANSDGSVAMSGAASASGSWWVANYQEYLPKGTYTVSGIFEGIADTSQLYAYVTDRASTKTLAIIRPTKKEMTFVLNEDLQAVGVSMAFPQAETATGKVWLQLERAAAATEYEQPKTTQTLTITTPGSLPGIPVASGGNYTDANGQQWIADEVDLARGVYVQRVATQQPADFAKLSNYDADGVPLFTAVLPVEVEGAAEWVDNNGYCTHMQYKNVLNHNQTGFYIVGKNLFVRVQDATDESAFAAMVSNAVFYYTMANPVETPLSDVELQAFLAMHSNKPTTTVLNDAGAHMALEYAADPKTYIDNKLAALVAANS